MNEKQGNHSDQRIRQTLGMLPDAPPPGSAFDSAALWERMRPELASQSIAAQPVQPVAGRKRPVFGWWLAAASVVLLLGWLWWPRQVSPLPSIATRKLLEKTGVRIDLLAKPNPSVNQPNVAVLPIDARLATAFPKHQHQHTNRTATGPILMKKPDKLVVNQPSIADDESIVLSAETVLVLPELETLTLASTQKLAIAAVPKRRFRVVHTNEIAAEEESNVVRYRAERFVRVGTGSPLSVPDNNDDNLPALLLPINRKSIQ